ncbi:MAG: flagellar export chaperone FliS [Desulfobacterales bacterium]|nr:flagellar export chaperone FliS [Desulfobacterales bacterium]
MQNYNQQVYRETEVSTADRGKLVVLLYDGAVNFLEKAKQAIRERNIPEKANNINRAQDIIQELQYALRMDVGGEIAENLNRLYQFMVVHLLKGKISADGTQNIDEVITMLRQLNKAWREIITRPEVQAIKEKDLPDANGISRGIAV